jgi:hypothetical protein
MADKGIAIIHPNATTVFNAAHTLKLLPDPLTIKREES